MNVARSVAEVLSRHTKLTLEVKAPEHPRDPAEQRESFLREFLAEEQDVALVRKFLDSRLYEWACGEVDKPVHYWVIVAIDDLGPPELANRADVLRRKLPVVESLPDRGKRGTVEDCRIFNIRTWNEAPPAAFMLERVDT